MKIVITGSAGYIGSCLFEYLKKKYEVFGVDKTLPKIKKQKNFIQCNLLNFNKIDKIINSVYNKGVELCRQLIETKSEK